MKSQSWPIRPGNKATLVIAPHPDDETLGCGLLIATRKAVAEKLHVVILTDGESSHQGHPSLSPERLGLLRREESTKALLLLGVGEAGIHFLGLPDGRLSHLNASQQQDAAEKIRAILTLESFDEVFLPWRHDGSSEHEGAFRFLSGLLPADLRILEYVVWARWRPWLLEKAFTGSYSVYRHSGAPFERTKRKAIGFYESQACPVPPWTQSVLPSGFLDFFRNPEEFFLEMKKTDQHD